MDVPQKSSSKESYDPNDKTFGKNVGELSDYAPPVNFMNSTSNVQNVIGRHPWTVAILSMAAVSLFFFTT